MAKIGFFPSRAWPANFWPEHFWPETPSSGVPTKYCLDTVSILEKWAENLSIRRILVSYNDAGIQTIVWNEINTFDGDWQPNEGNVVYKKYGLLINSDSRVITPCFVDIREGDRIYRDDGEFYDVVTVLKYEDHSTVFLKHIG